MNLKERLTLALEQWDGAKTSSLALAEAILEMAQPQLNPTPWRVEPQREDRPPPHYRSEPPRIWIRDVLGGFVGTAKDLALAQRIVKAVNEVES